MAQSPTTERLPAIIAARSRPRPTYLLVSRATSMDRTGLQGGGLLTIRVLQTRSEVDQRSDPPYGHAPSLDTTIPLTCRA